MRIITICTALGTTALIAGCGGGATPQNSASAGSGGPKDGVQAAYRFSACMRNHGVTNFPDPIVHTTGPGSQSVALKVDPSETSSPNFKSAQQACQSILPAPNPGQQAAEEHAHAEHLLAFARCMRAHGVNGFPDPNAQGDIRPEMLSSAGVDIQSPSVQKAAYTCVPSSGGVVSAAAIRQAVSGGGG